MSKYTPGPWVVTEHSAGMVCVAGPDHKDLCAVGYNRTEGRNDVANATLIAAAPAMYAALREAEKHLTDLANYGAEGIPEPLLVSVRSAIAQAEGR